MAKPVDEYLENHLEFIEQVRSSRKVWGLKKGDEWALCASNEFDDAEVYPFWSSPQAAKTHCVDEWSEYTPGEIEFDDFVDIWLVGLHEDELLVGTNWNKELAGLELEPEDLAKELLHEEDD